MQTSRILPPVLVLACCAIASGQTTFQSMGADFTPTAMSRDGGTVVGTRFPPRSGTRWTPPGGHVELEGLGPDPNSYALCLSGDGSVAGGFCGIDLATTWDADGAPTQLYPRYSFVFGLDETGAVAAGSINNAAHPRSGFIRGGAWGAEWFMLNSSLLGVSADGETVVGTYSTGPAHNEALRITAGAGVEILGVPPGFVRATATSVSDDGSVIAGEVLDSQLESRAFVWTEAGGFRMLVGASEIPSISGDGVLVYGIRHPVSAVSLLWSESAGLMNARAVFQAHGLDLTGRTISSVAGVGRDRRHFAVRGRGPGAQERFSWYVVTDSPVGDAGEPTACSADVNGDGVTNLTDLALLLSRFGLASGATYGHGDVDGDFDVDTSDLALLLAHFGCR